MPAAETTRRLMPSLTRSGRRTAALWLATLAAYWLVLFTATHIPTPDLVGDVMQLDVDKLIHFGAYFVLATLLCIAWRRNDAAFGWRGRLAVAGIVIAYGAADELTQPFVGRTCDLIDWLADAAGVATAIGIDQWRKGNRAGDRPHVAGAAQ